MDEETVLECVNWINLAQDMILCVKQSRRKSCSALFS
jgi:hypothetical protein